MGLNVCKKITSLDGKRKGFLQQLFGTLFILCVCGGGGGGGGGGAVNVTANYKITF